MGSVKGGPECNPKSLFTFVLNLCRLSYPLTKGAEFALYLSKCSSICSTPQFLQIRLYPVHMNE